MWSKGMQNTKEYRSVRFLGKPYPPYPLLVPLPPLSLLHAYSPSHLSPRAEVRSAAVGSMCQLGMHSRRFAVQSLDFLVDMFNDEIEGVRLEAIRSLCQISSTLELREDQLETVLTILEVCGLWRNWRGEREEEGGEGGGGVSGGEGRPAGDSAGYPGGVCVTGSAGDSAGYPK